MRAIPLLIFPLIAYNVVVFGLAAEGAAIWASVVFSTAMVSGAVWTVTAGDVMIAASLLVLFLEIIKATRAGPSAVVDHILSTLVFIAFLVEFIVVAEAATSVFFILTLMALIDVIAGFAVSIRSAQRDVSVSGGGLL